MPTPGDPLTELTVKALLFPEQEPKALGPFLQVQTAGFVGQSPAFCQGCGQGHSQPATLFLHLWPDHKQGHLLSTLPNLWGPSRVSALATWVGGAEAGPSSQLLFPGPGTKH